jgi:hypothetical protein
MLCMMQQLTVCVQAAAHPRDGRWLPRPLLLVPRRRCCCFVEQGCSSQLSAARMLSLARESRGTSRAGRDGEGLGVWSR